MADNREAFAVVKKPIMSIGGTVEEMKAANVAFGASLTEPSRCGSGLAGIA